MKIRVVLEYLGFGTAQSGGEAPGSFEKTFEVEGWGRVPMAGEHLRISRGGNAPIVKIAGVTFGVDGSVTLWSDEVKHGPGIDRASLEREGWQEY